ncbi:MAG: hypothetical protein ABJR05_03915 [Balneola sp.]
MLLLIEQFDWLKETIKRVSSVFEMESEKKISFEVYEELDIDIRSALSNNNLKKFVDQNLITSDSSKEISNFRDQLIELIDKRIEPEQILSNENWKIISRKAEIIYEAIINKPMY